MRDAGCRMPLTALRWEVQGGADALVKPFVALSGAVGLVGVKGSAATPGAVVLLFYTVKLVRYT